MSWKSTIFILAVLLGSGADGLAQETTAIVPGVAVEHFKVNRNGKYLTVELGVDLAGLDVASNRAVLLTPRLVSGADSLDLPSIGVYGRRRYYYYMRNGISDILGEQEAVYKASRKPDNMDYHRLVLYEEWMDGAALKFHRRDLGAAMKHWRNTRASSDITTRSSSLSWCSCVPKPKSRKPVRCRARLS